MKKENIYELVKEYFSLDEDSLSLFKERLFDPDIDEVYQNFGLDENLRAYFKIDRKDYHKYDIAWQKYQNFYKAFVEEYNLKYEDFNEGKVTINKNRVKLVKAMINYYMENGLSGKNKPIADVAADPCFGFKGREAEAIGVLKEKNEFTYFNSFASFVYRKAKDSDYYAKYGDLPKNYEEVLPSYYEEYVTEIITREMVQELGSNKLPNKDLYLVISLNFEDWFFCSSGETWTSCLNINGDFSYWSGLPSLVTDKNRALLYLTDREKKRPLEGYNLVFEDGTNPNDITVDRMIFRAWLILNDLGGIQVMRQYPSRYLKSNDINQITRSRKFEEAINSKGAKHKFDLMYHDSGYSLAIYLDNMRVDHRSAPKRGSYVFDKFGGAITCFDRNNLASIPQTPISKIKGGLRYLVSKYKDLYYFTSNIEYCFCTSCNQFMTEDDAYFDHWSDPYCEECFFERYFYCERCGGTMGYDETYFICEGNGMNYCPECAERIMLDSEGEFHFSKRN